jgi:predicted nucleotidyltransferase
MNDLGKVLADDPRVAYALLFGSSARGSTHSDSDIDVAVGFHEGTRLEPGDIGDLISRLERAAKRPIDLLLLDEAPVAVAYRVFRDGHVIVERDRRALVARKTRAILDYLDFRPFEELTTRGVLAAAARGR